MKCEKYRACKTAIFQEHCPMCEATIKSKQLRIELEKANEHIGLQHTENQQQAEEIARLQGFVKKNAAALATAGVSVKEILKGETE